jgi:hypothetical protein
VSRNKLHQARTHHLNPKTPSNGFGSSQFHHYSYSTANLASSQLSDHDPMTIIFFKKWYSAPHLNKSPPHIQNDAIACYSRQLKPSPRFPTSRQSLPRYRIWASPARPLPEPWRSPRSSRRRTWRSTPPRRRSRSSSSLSTVSSTPLPSHDPIADFVPLIRLCPHSAGAPAGGADAARSPPERLHAVQVRDFLRSPPDPVRSLHRSARFVPLV